MDIGGLLGPNYSFADELPTPSEMGIGRSGTFDGVARSVGGIKYYVDAMAFGENSFSNVLGSIHDQRPLGLRYFIKTGQTCDNGADMYEYINTVPTGVKVPGVDLRLRGLGPGIMDDTIAGINPMPYFETAMGTSYVKCKQVTLPVGDEYGNTTSTIDQDSVWIKEPTTSKYVGEGQIPGVSAGNKPHQTRWVFGSYISQDDYANTPKTFKPGDLPTEGFANRNDARSTQPNELYLAAMISVGMVIGLSLFGSWK
jgi:hypothetical protein